MQFLCIKQKICDSSTMKSRENIKDIICKLDLDQEKPDLRLMDLGKK